MASKVVATCGKDLVLAVLTMPQLPALVFQDEQLALQSRGRGGQLSQVVGTQQGWHGSGAASQ